MRDVLPAGRPRLPPARSALRVPIALASGHQISLESNLHGAATVPFVVADSFGLILRFQRRVKPTGFPN